MKEKEILLINMFMNSFLSILPQSKSNINEEYG